MQIYKTVCLGIHVCITLSLTQSLVLGSETFTLDGDLLGYQPLRWEHACYGDIVAGLIPIGLTTIQVFSTILQLFTTIISFDYFLLYSFA